MRSLLAPTATGWHSSGLTGHWDYTKFLFSKIPLIPAGNGLKRLGQAVFWEGSGEVTAGVGGGATGGPGLCPTQGTLTAELHGQLRPGDIQLQQTGV